MGHLLRVGLVALALQAAAPSEAFAKPVRWGGNGHLPASAAVVSAAAAREGEWAPWESLGGDVRSLPECQMQGRTVDCWALSAGRPPEPGSTMAWLRGDGETWAAWVNLDGTLRAAPECVSRGHGIDCFAANVATREGGGLGHIAYDGRDWGGWTSLGGSVKQKPACLAGPGQRVACLALAADDSGWWYYAFDGQEWAPATKIAFNASVASTLRPMCADTARGTACFAVDTTKQLWTIRRGKDDAWGDWEPLATGIAEPPHCLASGVKLDCFTRSVSNRLTSASFNGNTWSQWLEVGGGEATVQSQPYCNELKSGFDCYWTSAANTLVRRRTDHAVWLPEEDLGGAVRARPECLATPGGQRIDCFVQGVDNTLQRRSWD